MKKYLISIGVSLLGAGCWGHRASQPIVSAVAEEQTVSVEVQPADTPIPQPVPEKQPATVSPASQPAQPAVAVKSISEESAQEPMKPVPDKAVFQDETLISLKGRALNPWAGLVPSSDKQFSAAWKGEQLKYGLYYSFVRVGTAYIKNRGIVEVNGRQAYLLQTSAFSAAVIDKVFKVRDINLSWLDANNHYSLGYSQSLREGNYRRDEWVIFDYDTHTYHGEVTKKSGKRAFSGEILQPVQDLLTSLYFVRAQALQGNQDVVFDILNREEKYPLVVKIVGRETVKTPAGKFKCIIVEPQFRGEGIFVSKGKSLRVWVTDDERKLPVKMKAEVFIGSVSGELLEYKYN